MKFIRLYPLVAALGLGAIALARGAEPDQVPGPALDVTVNPPVTTTVTTTSNAWTNLKGFGFDMREQVFAGLKGVEARVDAQISELAAKREALVASNTSTQAWDLTMQEMTISRTALKSAISDLNDASRETWDQMKDRVTDALTRTQDAYTKVKSSTTK